MVCIINLPPGCNGVNLSAKVWRGTPTPVSDGPAMFTMGYSSQTSLINMLLYNREFLSNEAFGPRKVLAKE